MAHDRTAEALIGWRGRYRIDEPLARGADQEGEAERLELAKPRDRSDALLWRLAESDAGVEHDHVARNAGALGNGERAGEERRDVGHDVDAIDGEALGMLDRALRIKKAATVGEAVRCDVDHTHDDRPTTAEKLSQ